MKEWGVHAANKTWWPARPGSTRSCRHSSGYKKGSEVNAVISGKKAMRTWWAVDLEI